MLNDCINHHVLVHIPNLLALHLIYTQSKSQNHSGKRDNNRKQNKKQWWQWKVSQIMILKIMGDIILLVEVSTQIWTRLAPIAIVVTEMRVVGIKLVISTSNPLPRTLCQGTSRYKRSDITNIDGSYKGVQL